MNMWMKMMKWSRVALLLGVMGCVNSRISVRYDGLAPDWRRATTQRKYHITSIQSCNPELERLYQAAGGPNASLPTSFTFPNTIIRQIERCCPETFDEDGLPVDVRIVVSGEKTDSALLKLPLGLLFVCTLGISPFKSMDSVDVLNYQVTVSDSTSPVLFSQKQRIETWGSSIGLSHVMPFSSLEQADLDVELDERSETELRKLQARAIAAALAEAERRNAVSPAKKRNGTRVGD